MKKIVVVIALLCSLNLSAADLKWALKTNGGDVVLMGNVSHLLYSDGATTFSVVCKDNKTIANVQNVKFLQVDPTGVGAVNNQGGMEAKVVDQTLSIVGAEADVEVDVLTVGGKVLLSTKTVEGKTDVYVGGLAGGTYILKVGKTAVKFQKK